MRNNFTTFYIVRHGETESNVNRILSGQSDSPLTENGIQQIEMTKEKLKHVHFDAAFSSDLLRAKRTAEIIALEKKLAIQVTQLLRERNFGAYEGKPYDSLKIYEALIEKLSDEELKKYKVSKNYESDEEIVSRFITFIRQTAVVHAAKTVLVASHGSMIRVLLVHLGYGTYKELRHGLVKNAGYIKLLSDGVEFEVKETYGIDIPKK